MLHSKIVEIENNTLVESTICPDSTTIIYLLNNVIVSKTYPSNCRWNLKASKTSEQYWRVSPSSSSKFAVPPSALSFQSFNSFTFSLACFRRSSHFSAENTRSTVAMCVPDFQGCLQFKNVANGTWQATWNAHTSIQQPATVWTRP